MNGENFVVTFVENGAVITAGSRRRVVEKVSDEEELFYSDLLMALAKMFGFKADIEDVKRL